MRCASEQALCCSCTWTPSPAPGSCTVQGSQQLPLVPTSVAFRMEVLQGNTCQWPAFPSVLKGGFPERSPGKPAQLPIWHSVSHGQPSARSASQSWGVVGRSPVSALGWWKQCICHSFDLYCYFLLASPSLLQSSGVVTFKFKLLCGFCFLIGSLLLSCIIVAFHSAKFFVPPTPPPPAKTSLPLL